MIQHSAQKALVIKVRLDLNGKDAIRRLRIPADITFEQLHTVLQAAFGWKNYHQYSFGLFEEWGDNNTAKPDIKLVITKDELSENPGLKQMTGIKVSDYVPKYRKILYAYDYGDDWRHYIEVEKIINDCEEDLPALLSGEGDSPPEDLGGASCFAEFTKIIDDPTSAKYKDMNAWAESQNWKPFDYESAAKLVKAAL
jgi:hypothetical protein